MRCRLSPVRSLTSLTFCPSPGRLVHVDITAGDPAENTRRCTENCHAYVHLHTKCNTTPKFRFDPPHVNSDLPDIIRESERVEQLYLSHFVGNVVMEGRSGGGMLVPTWLNPPPHHSLGLLLRGKRIYCARASVCVCVWGRKARAKCLVLNHTPPPLFPPQTSRPHWIYTQHTRMNTHSVVSLHTHLLTLRHSDWKCFNNSLIFRYSMLWCPV